MASSSSQVYLSCLPFKYPNFKWVYKVNSSNNGVVLSVIIQFKDGFMGKIFSFATIQGYNYEFNGNGYY